jgi:hypothetical protein
MQSGDKVYYVDFTDGIKEVTFVESWEYNHSYIRDGVESYQVDDSRLFSTIDLAREFIRKSKRLYIKSDEDRIIIMNILKESNPGRYAIDNPYSILNMVLDMAKLEGIGIDDIKSVADSILICDEQKFISKLEKCFK